MSKINYNDYSIKVNWKKHVRGFWGVNGPTEFDRYFSIGVPALTDINLVDVKNDILIFRPHIPFDKSIFNLLDKGVRFIIDCTWEIESFTFAELQSYAENGIAIISGTPCKNEDWPIEKTFFSPMSFWFIEYYRSLLSDTAHLNFKRNKITHEFLMPIKTKRKYKQLFIDLLGNNITKGLYSIVWENKLLPEDVFTGAEQYDWNKERFYNPKWYNSTYYSMVVETSQDLQVFITEKTFKPIMYGHPFMIYGANGILKILKENGFHTFPELFDERYDDEKDPVKRAKLIVSQIEQFDAKSMKTNKVALDKKIYANFHRFYNKDEMTKCLNTEIRTPIERFIFER